MKEKIVNQELVKLSKKVNSEISRLKKLVTDLPKVVSEIEIPLENRANKSEYLLWKNDIYKVLYKNKDILLVSKYFQDEDDYSKDYIILQLTDSIYTDTDYEYKLNPKNLITFEKENFDQSLFSPDKTVREMTIKMIKNEIKNARKSNAGPA